MVTITGKYSDEKGKIDEEAFSVPGEKCWAYIRGLQFYTFFGISIGITWRMIDIGKK